MSFLRLIVSIRTVENDSNTLFVDACDFFDNTEKNRSFPNYAYLWTGPKKTGLMQAL